MTAAGNDTATQQRSLLLALGLSTFVVSLDGRIVAPLLPAIAAEFRTSLAAASYTVSSYLLPYGLCQLAYGPTASAHRNEDDLPRRAQDLAGAVAGPGLRRGCAVHGLLSVRQRLARGALPQPLVLDRRGARRRGRGPGPDDALADSVAAPPERRANGRRRQRADGGFLPDLRRRP